MSSTSVSILVVDDSPTTRRLIRSSLLTLGYKNITEADDGTSALKELKGNDYDILITDWNMPVMSGLELTNIVRGDSKLSKIPIVMITTKGEKEDIQKAIKFKVNGYIVKPFNTEVLGRTIKPIADNIHKIEPDKTNNRIKIQITITGDDFEKIDEIQISKTVKLGKDKSENSSTILNNISKDFVLSTQFNISPKNFDFEAETLDKTKNHKVKLFL